MTTQTKSFLSMAAFIAAALLQSACSAGDGRAPRAKGFDQAYGSEPTPAHSDAGLAVCLTGETKRCQVYLPAHNGVHPCILGYQICKDDTWSDCIEGNPGDHDTAEGDAGVGQGSMVFIEP